MGLFSDGHETYVSTSASRVVADNKIISSIKSGTVKAIFEKGDIVDYIMEDMINGIGFTGRSFHKFGATRYPYGLPIGTGLTKNSMGGSLVAELFLELYGENAQVISNNVTPYNFAFEALRLIDQMYDHNADTDELRVLSAQKGAKVTMQAVILTFGPNMLDTMPMLAFDPITGFKAIAVQQDSGMFNNTIHVTVEYSYVDPTPNGLGQFDTVYGNAVVSPNIWSELYNPNEYYFQTVWSLNGEYEYWRYKVGNGTFPTLDNVFNPAFDDTRGSYFPWVYFRFNKIKGIEDPDQAGYLAAKKMCKKIHMDYDKICNEIHKNPDITDVKQAILMWSVEADSQHKEDIEYLYEYFNRAFLNTGGKVWNQSFETLGNWTEESQFLVASLSGANPGTTVIQDARFKMAVGQSAIYRKQVVGNIGPLNSYTAGRVDLQGKYAIYDYGNYGEGNTIPEGRVIGYNDLITPCHWYRKQISATKYDEIFIFGMTVMYYIDGNYMVTANGNSTTANYETHDAVNDILLIPLDFQLTKEMSLKKREILYARSLQFIFNSEVTVSVKWYQSDFFQGVVFVVAAYLMVTGIGEGLMNFAAGAAALTTEQIIMQVVINGLNYLGTAVAFKIFIKVVGVKIAFLVAIIAMAYGISAKFGDEIGMSLSQDMPFAGDLLKVGTGLSKAIKSEIAGDLTGMKKEMESMKKDMDALKAQAKTIEDEMAENSTYAPFIPLTVEEPEDFYNRTIHAGNIGMIGIDAVSNYVRRSLALPEPKLSGA